jgi:hypothetical protein
MDQHEALLGKELLEQRADTALDDEYGLVDFRAKVDGPIVQPGVEAHKWPFLALNLLVPISRHRPFCVFDLEWQWDLRLDLDEQLLHMDLKVLDGGALDWLLHPLDETCDDERALCANAPAVFDHLLAKLVAGSHDSLHSVETLAQVEEGELRRLDASVLYPAAECDLLVLIVGSISYVGSWGARGLEFDGTAEWQVAVCSSRYIGSIVGLLFGAFGELAGFGGSLLLCLVSISNHSLMDVYVSCAFSFSFCAFFRAFLDGASGCPASFGGAASLMVAELW